MTAFNADAREHQHRREYVFPDGVHLGTVIDAIAAAGLAENYVLANELKIRYAIDVCTRCARRHVRTGEPPHAIAALSEYGIDAWGTICAVCELDLLATGRQKRRL